MHEQCAILAHALTHYEEGGWDVLVECFTEKDLVEWAQRYSEGPVTPETLWSGARLLAEAHAERQADARNSAF